MNIKAIIKQNTYFDSVSLMALSTRANDIDGIKQVNISMGTDKNKEVLHNNGLLTDEADQATPGDLIIVIEGEEGRDLEVLSEAVEEALSAKNVQSTTSGTTEFTSIQSGVSQRPDANLTVISVPGEYAYRYAKQALDHDLHAMIFSDNMSLEEEIKLKTYAHQKGLLVMGPDCGTAIINGKGLCFANEVRRGSIGIVAASGTGAQEISVLVHGFGGGVSQLIGVGGRDLSEEVGGIMLIDGLMALDSDPGTEVIILLSKTPAPAVAQKIYDQIPTVSKPVIICFINGNEDEIIESGAHYAKTTKRAALQAVILSGVPEESIDQHTLNMPLIDEIKAKLSDEQQYVRGLFCGGTVCQEVYYLLKEQYDNVYSNVAEKEHQLEDKERSQGHTLIDFGSDEYTQGRPHPMIDPSLRLERIVQEAKDPEVGVIALDFELGYGSMEDPVGVTLPALIEAKKIAEARGKHLEILGFVLGTDGDPQNLSKQIAMLEEVGVTIASSVENLGLLSRGFVEKGGTV